MSCHFQFYMRQKTLTYISIIIPSSRTSILFLKLFASSDIAAFWTLNFLHSSSNLWYLSLKLPFSRLDALSWDSSLAIISVNSLSVFSLCNKLHLSFFSASFSAWNLLLNSINASWFRDNWSNWLVNIAFCASAEANWSSTLSFCTIRSSYFFWYTSSFRTREF